MEACANCRLPRANERITGGAHPLCEPCNNLLERTDSIRLTPLEREDLELVLAWRSSPKIYRHFRDQTGPLDWESHVSWFESRNPDRHDFIIRYRGRRVGVVSLATNEEVSIYLGDCSARGHGVATATLAWLCERFEERTPLFAIIHEENASSKQLFKRCGFDQRGRAGDWLQYIYDP